MSDYGYGYSSQGSSGGGGGGGGGAHRSSNVNGIRAVPAAGGGYGQHQPQQQQQPPPQHASPAGVQGIARVDRSSAINEYVAKQKAAKQNAPLIRKENQRVAEARAMSASRSKGESREEYVDDYSNQGGGYDEPPLPAQQVRNAASARPSMPPQQQAQSMGRPAASSANPPDRRAAPVGAPPARSSIAPPGGPRYAEENSGYGVGPPSSSGSSSSVGGLGPSSGGGGGPSNAELVKRVHLLEEQIRLLKQQNKIFLSFMQNTEQQLAELRAAPPALAPPPAAASQRSSGRSNNGGGYDAPPAAQQQQQGASSAYPNNMSNITKAGLQRAQSERPQMPGSSRSAAPQQQQQQPPPLNALGGQSDVDQTWAPAEDDQARKERLRSAKKKKELLNLRSKMKGGALPGAPGQQQDQQDDSRGGRYQADAYQDDYGGGGGGYGAPPQQQQRSGAPSQRGAPPQQQQQQQQQQRRGPPPPAASHYQDAPDPNDSFTGGGAGVPEGADEIVETYPCPNCDRRFNEVALAKHVAKQLCKQKPRKTFDMAAQRLENLAQEAREAGIVLLPPKKGPGAAAAAAAAAQKAPTKKVSKWRADHEKFMAAIQAGKQMQAALDSGVPLSSLPPPVTREEDDDRTPCPHCGRKFESGVADRHIPHCKNTKNKPKSTTASIARLGSTSTAAKRR